jgi:hypothetical protein
MRENQNYVDPGNPDRDSDPDPQHWRGLSQKILTKSLKPNPMSVNLGPLLQISNFCGNAVKGSRQRLRRGVGKVPNDHNMSLTAAIDVLFSINFSVVF